MEVMKGMNASTSFLRVRDLRCEYQLNSMGIDVKEPRLSWKLVADQRGATQSAYQIRVSDEQGEVWDSGKVVSARLYMTAHGLYDVSLNGQRVGDAYFTPGYTSYQHRLQYQVYDVGEL